MIHLMLQYCNTADPARQAEFDACVARNLDHPWVAEVHNLVEPGVRVPETLAGHPKYRETRVPAWLTYAAALDHAATHLAGQVVGLCNLDIFLDPDSDWAAAADLVRARPVVLAQARWEWAPDRTPWKDESLMPLAFANSQDFWLFQAPLDVPDCAFELGLMGCDNAFADRIRATGRQPVNAPDRWRVFHYDRVRGKTGATALAVHKQTRQHGVLNRRPEEKGQYLLPDLDVVRSLDTLAGQLGLDELERYQIACDMMSARLRITND